MMPRPISAHTDAELQALHASILTLPRPPTRSTMDAASLPWPPVVRFVLDPFTRDLIGIVAALEAKDDRPAHLLRREIDEIRVLVWDCIGADAIRRAEALS